MDLRQFMKHFLVGSLIVIAGSFVLSPTSAKAKDIVDPYQTYTYNEMVRDIKALANKYPELIKYKVIGKSEWGNNIYAVSLGTGKAEVFINGSHHAREWLTTNLNMYMLDQYAQAYYSGKSIEGYHVKSILNKTKIWFVPMVNPDGVTLQQEGLDAFPQHYHDDLIQMNEWSKDFTRWKANANGVDLNRQYDADWANIKNNTGYPSWRNYKGTAPHQASEVKTIVNFTYEIDPEIAVAYHSAGKILYWNFHQTGSWYDRDHAYAKKIGNMTGYRLIYPGPNPSGGGYTDWFIIKFKKPGFTVEIGNYPGNRHLPIYEFGPTWQENKAVGLYVAKKGYDLYYAKHKDDPVEVNVEIDGVKQTFDQPAILEKGRTLVPLRGVFEKMGASVTWDQDSSTVHVKKDDKHISLKVGSKTAYINGEKVTLDVPSKMINYRTMVPLRFVSEALGAKVYWDSSSLTASIETPKEEPKPEAKYFEVGDKKYRIVTVIIDGKEQEYDTPALSINYRTMIPIRGSLEELGATFSWNQEKQQATVKTDEKTIVLTIGSKTAVVNGQEVELDVPAQEIKGRTLVPLRFLSETLNAEDIKWDEETYTVTITTKSEPATTNETTTEQNKETTTDQKAEEPATDENPEQDGTTEADPNKEEQPKEEQPANGEPTEEQPAEGQPEEEQPTEEQPKEEDPKTEEPTEEQPGETNPEDPNNPGSDAGTDSSKEETNTDSTKKEESTESDSSEKTNP
ncbi:stalk domain-containing protein [Pseudalkalibacillus sp. SCS-8]|uniref:stalk domain-containing protein n=1 Tax=Pseudalkalibacillus nanhaiensis TaxID=3115291 RepID=UPI0032DB6C06